MKRVSLILIAVFALVMLPAAFAQGTPSQSQDPSTQTPSTQPPSQSPSASPTQSPSTTPSQSPSTSPSTDNPSSATPSSSSSDAHNFVGSIVNKNGKFMLHTGGTDYELDDQSQAAKFEGKDVKVTGSVDQQSNTIRVQSISPASSM